MRGILGSGLLGGPIMTPAVSVIVEGYNAAGELGSMDDTMSALRAQRFPMREVEIILVGSSAQASEWERRFSSEADFHSVRAVGADGTKYYGFKNRGAGIARAPILAFTDSDATPFPEWLAVLVNGIRNGADVAAGISLFRDSQFASSYSPWLLAAASISWGFVAGAARDGSPVAKAFLSHNVGMRAEVFERMRFRSDLGRTCAGTLLHTALAAAGARIALQPEQRVAHAFRPWWWVTSLHPRFGYELWLLWGLEGGSRQGWVRCLGVFAPPLAMGWHVLLDIPQWFRVTRFLGMGAFRRVALLPLLFAFSVMARGAEMAGMYGALFAPRKMGRFAESN
jgi:glycosyltransferase involved in cell wall biosynthesis